jgi:hypothetical protein
MICEKKIEMSAHGVNVVRKKNLAIAEQFTPGVSTQHARRAPRELK